MIKGAEEVTSMVAKLLFFSLESHSHDVWMDRKDLRITSTELKASVSSQLDEKKVAIICIGVGDLERCSVDDDFFRWEIDRIRELENEGKLQVAVVVHGTIELTDLICGTEMAGKVRQRIIKSLEQCGKDLLEYLRKHYVIFFEIDQLDTIAEKVISML